MRRIRFILLTSMLLIVTPAFAGTGGENSAAPPAHGNVATPAARPAKPAPAQPVKPEKTLPPSEIQKLQDLIQAQQQELAYERTALEKQQKEIDALKGGTPDKTPSPAAKLDSEAQPLPDSAPALEPSESSSSAPALFGARRPEAKTPAKPPQSAEEGEQSPLFFKIGNTEFTPGGFLDLTTVYRSTNGGSGIGTNFNSIPYNTASPAGRLSETRFSAQNSRLTLKVDFNPKSFKAFGYLEADFLGNAPPNVLVSSNSDTLRMRVYFVDVRKGKWEFLGGQDWSMLTPNRVGISPMPGDIFFSQDMDTNYQLGLVWTRAPQFRIIYHANQNWTAGLALENPQQYTGTLVTFPAGFNAAQVETGSNSGAPNTAPDIQGKIAFDSKVGGHAVHVEGSGVIRTFRLNTSATSSNQYAVGGGGSVNANLELFKNLRLIVNTFFSDGGGRYVFGQGPDFAVRVNGSGDFVPSPLNTYSGIGGFEYQVRPSSMVYGYYSGAFFGKNFQATTTTGGTTYTGYGYPGSPSNQNRAIQEGTLGLVRMLWRNPTYGDLKIITQFSYLTRAPWSITGTPGGAKNAHLGMGFVDLRYDIP